jgi:hypothetical protein
MVLAGGVGGGVSGGGAVCAHTLADSHTNATIAPAQAVQCGVMTF